MKHLTVNWPILRGGNTSDGVSCVSELKYDEGWSIFCFWGKFSFPRFIEIRRKGEAEFAVSGHLTLLRNDTRIFKRKIKGKIVKTDDSKITAIRIKINYRPSPGESSVESTFALKGRLNVSSIKMVPITESRDIEIKQKLLESVCELSTDFAQLLDAETAPVAADVTLKCGNVSIPAHKIILCARSPVFAAMFASAMIESRENSVVFTDVDEVLVRAMVRHMYTGQPVEGMNVSLAQDLLIAADKYQLNSLKRECCDFLMQNISQENALILCDLGDAVAEDLKSCALSYICNSNEPSDIQSSGDWESLAKNKPVLLVEILANLVKSQDEKIKNLEAPCNKADLKATTPPS